ncbi:MAG: hypothetical protein J6T82_08970 [Bacteroidaceae bacterium]|nr:hypothetical protein [Bacteroidaceae bacterium]
MARIKKGILGDVEGQLGGVIGYRRNGKNFLRAAPASHHDKRSEGQMKQRKKFALVNEFILSAIPFFNIGYKVLAQQHTAYNAAMSYLLHHAIKEVDGDYLLNYQRIMVSLGTLLPAPNISLKEEEGMLLLTWDDNSGIGNAEPSDVAMFFIHHKVQKTSIYLLDGSRRADCGGKIPLKSGWNTKDLVFYLAFRRENYEEVSCSQPLFLISNP